MTAESFIRAMPKVELHIHLDGAMSKDSLATIAEQNDISETVKHFNQWLGLLDRPDYARLDELAHTVSQWVRQPEDLTRLVYELGVNLAKQNVRYAEVSIDPTLYIDNGLTFEQLLNAINDGRDRVERGWRVRLAWILTIPRDQPRRADDVVRWATSATAKKSSVVGLGLSGRQNAQPVVEFERAFKTAHKKGLPCVLHTGDTAESMLEVLQSLQPSRVVDGWGTADAPDVRDWLINQHIPLGICMAQDLCLGHVGRYADYPLRQLYDDGILVTLGSDMPSLYKTSLTEEYLAAVEHNGFSVEEIEIIALNAVRASLLPDEEKEELLRVFAAEYAQLRSEHLAHVLK
jgi:adenosine deaminase